MYPVSSGYLDAVRAKVRTDRLVGTIVFPDSTTLTVDDTVLVRDTVKLSRELCSGSYRIGTFSLACLRFAFFIDDALGLDLTGAYVTLSYGIDVGGTFENVPLGKFLIDPVQSVRRKDILSIVAYDEGIKFDVPPSDTLRELSGTPGDLIAAACTQCGVTNGVTAQALAALPNYSLTVQADGRQIQTCRDLIMWCAALMCCYAAVDRSGQLVLIPAKYAVQPEDQTVIITDRTVRQDERRNITVTDTRAYIKYLTAYSGDDTVSYTSAYVSTDEQASPAAYVLEKNPLLAGKTAAECDTANRAWLSYIGAFKQRGVSAEIFGDPAIDVGDTIAFMGGDVDQRSGIIGVVTGIVWRYRGTQDIACLAAECCGSLLSQSASYFSSGVRAQSDKRIDGLETGGSTSSGVGEDMGNGNERFNDYKNNSVSGQNNHVENESNTITGGSDNHAEGYKNTLESCYECHGSGSSNTVRNSVATTVSGAENQVTSATNCAVSGNINTVSGNDILVSGLSNTISTSNQAVVSGRNNTVSSASHYSNTSGENNKTIGSKSCTVSGTDNIVQSANNSLTCGEGNVNTGTDSIMCGTYGYNGGNYIAVGYGSSEQNRKLIFYVNTAGVYTNGSYNTIGADYAEYFEWADGNPDGEDRRGMLVSLDGDRLIPAHGDDILGAVSAVPSVIGNSADEHWRGRYKTDVFGCEILGEDGKPILSDDYDPEKKYISRAKRPEWAAVGLVGRLIVTDNGKCVPGGHVTARNGIAMPTLTKTNVRVLKRVDETHVEVLIK